MLFTPEKLLFPIKYVRPLASKFLAYSRSYYDNLVLFFYNLVLSFHNLVLPFENREMTCSE